MDYDDSLVAWAKSLDWGDLPPHPLKAFRRFSGLKVVGHKASERLKKRYHILCTMKNPERIRSVFGDDYLDQALSGRITDWERR